MTTPVDLARELGINAKLIRRWLRGSYPRLEPGKRWELSPDEVEAVRKHWSSPTSTSSRRMSRSGKSRATSDEAYVIDLLDELVGAMSNRQHRFEWLLGDPGRSARRTRLPVDAYWPELQLIAEYRERQHTKPTAFFDKPSVMTVSGVDRREQRRRYDARREELIPMHGLRLIVINTDDLACDTRGRLRRAREDDRIVLEALLGGLASHT